MTVLYIGDERIMNGNYWGMEAQYLMFLPLVAYEGDEAGDIEPRLAERWEHSDDYRTWTFYLRKDVRWHDGVPTTAHDVKFTEDLFKHSDVTKAGEDAYSVTVLDDFALRIVYKKPIDALNTWNTYYPKHLLEDLDPKDFYSWEFWIHPVGNGPYRYVRHVPKIMAEYEANPDYYRGKPKIDRIVLKFGTENALTELLSGNVDVAYPSQMDLLKLKDNPRFRTYHWWGSWIETIHWNQRNPLFREPTVRHALTLAINRRELAKVLNYPDGVPIFDVISSRRQYRQGLVPDPLPYDPERASRLLEEAGWRDIDGDSVLEKEGQEFRFTAIYPSGKAIGKAAIYVQEQFRRIGIRMEVQSFQNSLVMRRFRNGDFDAVFGRFKNGTKGNFQQLLLFGKKSNIGYTNPKLIEHLNTLKYTIDPAERDRIYREIMPIFQADLPITFLLPQIQTVVVHRRIRGLTNSIKWEPVWFAEYLWIEEED